MGHQDTGLWTNRQKREERVQNVKKLKALPLSLLSHLSLQRPLWPDQVVKDVFGHMGVHSRQWVVQQVDVSVTVQSPCQTYSLSLSTRQVDALGGEGIEPQTRTGRTDLYRSLN